jgi:hypothetical protein
VSLVPGRQKLVEGDLSSALTQRLYILDRVIDYRLPPLCLRHDPRYRATMSGDYYGLPALDFIEELGKVSFGLRSLNFAHRDTSAGRFD